MPASEAESEALRRQFAGPTAYVDAGEGEPIVFIHGVGLQADAWQPQIESFRHTHRVIAIDMLGHGSSEPASGNAMLADYVQQVKDLLDALGVTRANIVGHSMGGLVAIGFALSHPARTLRLAALNCVYERTGEQRAAVVARARQLESTGSTGDIEAPLRRWFGADALQSPAARRVRDWLQAAHPLGYARAYGIFAVSDGAFSGRLGKLAMPALFATGDGDQNSTPAMSHAMARAARRGKAVVLAGERHMMNVVNPGAVNAALRDWLQEAPTVIDSKDLRKAFGSFMTGVTVVTTRESNGTLRGFTANSFCSVSLDPPLLLVCINKAAASCEAFSGAPGFAVNILSEAQKEISGIFASKRPDKFEVAEFTFSNNGHPLLAGSVAWFDCTRHRLVEAGDHVILIGRVESYAHTDASPLGYARGGYVTLGLEQSAVNAAADAGRTEVGAILEHDGKLLAFGSPGGIIELPHVGRGGEAGSASALIARLAAQGIGAKLGFLYAVYENREDRTQSIYYRGEAVKVSGNGFLLLDFDDLPWGKLRDDATRSMLRRYSAERLEGRFRIYSGDHISGDVRDID